MNRTLLIVSDTGMFIKQGKVYAFQPVVMEVLLFLEFFSHITWIGAQQDYQKNNASFTPIPLQNVTPILLPTPSSTGLKYKLQMLFNYPKIYHIIKREIKKHTYIHSRAPSHPAYLTMRLSHKFEEKYFWFKYAGSWVEPAPWFYNLQRKKLTKLKANSKVTINGKWPHLPENILPFENPCVNEIHREEGAQIIKHKTLPKKINFCFVGGLNENKGIHKIISAWSQINNSNLGTLYIVGKGKLEFTLKQQAQSIKHSIQFLGTLSKEEVHQVYKNSSFIILPSKTEGFPKVIGEAMNFGCVPIVSQISCLNQYITTLKNGWLLENNDATDIVNAVQNALEIDSEKFKEMINTNHNIAAKFTYSYYRERIEKEVFNLK